MTIDIKTYMLRSFTCTSNILLTVIVRFKMLKDLINYLQSCHNKVQKSTLIAIIMCIVLLNSNLCLTVLRVEDPAAYLR